MTGPDIEIMIAKAAYTLMQTGPAWDDFMKALVARADRLTDGLVTADNANIHRMQGQAREAREFLTTLANARTLAEKAYDKEKAKL